jgi:hypothetical protein
VVLRICSPVHRSATAVGGGRSQGHDGAFPCPRRRAPVDGLDVISVLRRTPVMYTSEVLSTKVLHRCHIFAIVAQALRLPSGRSAVR